MVKNIQKNKEDLFKNKDKFKRLYGQLSKKKLYKHPENNEIIKKYIDAKKKGNYKRIIYNVNNPEATCSYNLEKLKILEDLFKKPFTKLTQNDIDKLQDTLNDNKLKTKPQKNIPSKPIKTSYKLDLISQIKQFWKFYRLYAREELGKELKDITEYLTIKRTHKEEDIIYLEYADILELIKHTKNLQQKILFLLAFDSGARPIEILTVQRKHFLYDKEQKLWTVKLPDKKGISTDKARVELEIASNEVDKYFLQNNFNPDDYIFQYSYDYTRKLIREMGLKIGKKLTPKVFRKSSTMYLINQGATEQYIKAHQGWSINTRAMNSYVKQAGIKTPDYLKARIRKDAHQDYETTQALMKSELDQMKNLIKDLMNFKEETKKDILTKKEIDIRNDQTKQILKQFHKITKTTKK